MVICNQLSENNAILTVIKAYGPTQVKASADESIRDLFYDQLEATLNKLRKRSILCIAGDFNAKIGQDWTSTRCIGRFCRGIRNPNGQELVEFSEAQDLFATNTRFQHRACHRTTWKQEPNHPALTLGLPNQLKSIEDLRTLEALATTEVGHDCELYNGNASTCAAGADSTLPQTAQGRKATIIKKN
jgi:hypothetical protein